ncbi:MAG: hypothetical protein BroJett040_06950 [Oligoflexia bacterium]|nr:MAG: hypothetical protein BroJett040_06950 [Oligoflexia bacterium]
MKIIIALLLPILFMLSTQAKSLTQEYNLENVQTWEEFSRKVKLKTDKEQEEGRAYMISGGLLLVGSVVGYHNAHSSVEKLAYSVAQSLGIGGIGYGSYLYNIGGEERVIYTTILRADLGSHEKDALVRSYTHQWKENKQRDKMIRIVTHSLVGILNIYNGARVPSSEEDLRQGLYALGGINLLAALSLTITY